MSEETPVSWRAVTAHCPVIGSDGEQVGTVLDVAVAGEDIFHGIVFHHHTFGHPYVALSSSVDRITERAVYLNVNSAAAAQFQEFHQLQVEHLGLTGHFFWKHVTWRDSNQ